MSGYRSPWKSEWVWRRRRRRWECKMERERVELSGHLSLDVISDGYDGVVGEL